MKGITFLRSHNAFPFGPLFICIYLFPTFLRYSNSSSSTPIMYVPFFCSFIIVHRNPKHIQVSVRSQILGMSEMELDLFDAIIRLVKQDDDALYQYVSNMRWRRFFESDFMVPFLLFTQSL